MSGTKPHWRTPDDTTDELEVGDRIVGICQWSERHSAAVKRHVITLTIHEDGVIRDNEEQGYCLHDCECWMPELEFLRVFGPEVEQ